MDTVEEDRSTLGIENQKGAIQEMHKLYDTLVTPKNFKGRRK